MTLRERWSAAANLVASHRDVLDARPHDGVVPEALVRREWDAYLLALEDAPLAALEVGGLETEWPNDAPLSLVALTAQARAVTEVAPIVPANEPARSSRQHESPRKTAQIDAFARLLRPLASSATRIVDVGSGHGHLTRAIAERIALPVIGLERDVELATRARELTSGNATSFAITDVMRDGLPLAPGDCVIGLHACGELGDAIVESAAEQAELSSVVLVGCCLQKRSDPSRTPLVSSASAFGAALDLPKDILGLSNLTPREEGVEATRAENLAARERRLALHRLLAEDGLDVRAFSEIEGLNRRAAQHDLASLVERAFRLRRRPSPSIAAIAEAAAWAHVQHARARRLSIPRAMLARALEVYVLLDRALYLEERGFTVAVGTLFSADVSARNLALSARLT